MVADGIHLPTYAIAPLLASSSTAVLTTINHKSKASRVEWARSRWSGPACSRPVPTACSYWNSRGTTCLHVPIRAALPQGGRSASTPKHVTCLYASIESDL